MFMQQLKSDQDQAAPESEKQTAAATLPQMFAPTMQPGGDKKVIPTLAYFDNLKAAQRMMGEALPSVVKHLYDLVHAKVLNNVPAKSEM